MALYLLDYLQEKILAAWLYALYNGGPGQRKPFLNRYHSEKLFPQRTTLSRQI